MSKLSREEFELIEDHINSTATRLKISDLLTNAELAKQPDDDPLNPWANLKDTLQGNISKFDAMGLQLTSLMLVGVFNKNNPPSADTKVFMQKFIENSIGDTELNYFLNQPVVQKQKEFTVLTTSYAINKIAYFCFKTRHLENKEQSLEKLAYIHEAIINNQPIKNKDKLSLKELGLASDLAKTKYFLDKLYEAGFIEGNAKLEQMHKNAGLAKNIMNHIEQANKVKFQEAGPGVIILDDTYKKADLLDTTLRLIDKVVILFSGYRHIAILHFDHDKKTQRSHLYPKISKDNFDITKQLYADSYKIDPVALVPKQKQQLLAQIYGENWQANVIDKFQFIQNEIHTETNKTFGNLQASEGKDQALSGLANIIPFGHKKLAANDFKELHRKVINEEYAKQQDTKMLCSEFCATTIAVTFVELDKQIKEDMKNNKAIKMMGIDLEKENIVTIPFGKHEDLHKMHPDRLLSVLKSYKCVEPVVTEDQKYIKHQTKSAARKIVSKIKNYLTGKATHKNSAKPVSSKQNSLTH